MAQQDEYSVSLRVYPHLNKMMDTISTWGYPRTNPPPASDRPFQNKSQSAVNKSSRKSTTMERLRSKVENHRLTPRYRELEENTKPLWLKFTQHVNDDMWVCETNQGIFNISKDRYGKHLAYFISGNGGLSPMFAGKSFGKSMVELCRWRGFHSHGSLFDLYPNIHWNVGKVPRNNTRTITHHQGFFFWWEHDLNYKGTVLPIGKGQDVIQGMQERKTVNPARRKNFKNVNKRAVKKRRKSGWSTEELIQGYRNPAKI